MESQQAQCSTTILDKNQTTFQHIMFYETRLQEIKVISCPKKLEKYHILLLNSSVCACSPLLAAQTLREYGQTTRVLNKENILQQGVVGGNEQINLIIHSPIGYVCLNNQRVSYGLRSILYD